MSQVKEATLADGRVIKYVEVSNPPAGGMKKTYFTPDKSYVIQFFHDQEASKDPERKARLDAILGKYNPCLAEDQGGASGTSRESAEYFKNLFCWPTAIVVKPQFGIMAPTYPTNFFFESGQWKGKEKSGKWFSSQKLRGYLPEGELGNWLRFFQICILMSRAVRRLHQAGLAHSDLSCNNILIDPVNGKSVVIDIDSLVVPGLYPPDVIGTPGYIAPEVIATQKLSIKDRNKNLPSIYTDLHALAVLIYEYLLFRHPLRGPKVHSVNSAEEDEQLSMGEKALFIEHPNDKSNRPSDLKLSYKILGPYLCDLMERAFVKGLHAPRQRPSAMEWEKGLIKTWDLLHPCPNKSCKHQWFILDVSTMKCPACGARISGSVPILNLRSEKRPGVWVSSGQLVGYHNSTAFNWHVYNNIFPGEAADRTPQAYCVFHRGQWLLVNINLDSLTSPGGNIVPPGQAVVLKDGAQIRLSQEEKGQIAEVKLVRG